MEESVMFGIVGMVLILLYALRPKTAPAAVVPGAPIVPAPIVPGPIVEPIPGNTIQQLIETVAREYHQDPALMKAICRKESAFDPVAVNENDPSYGLGQIMPFWVWYFGAVAEGDVQGAVRLLLNARSNLEIQAKILIYFKSKGFRFPEQVDVYNVGETLWAKGIRNTSYRADVQSFYRSYGGL